jgi:hypothetical protein
MHKISTVILPLVSLACVVLFATAAGAEPMFLSRQYVRCSSCHYSPTGGGLLTPYGRSLSGKELSMSGRTLTASSPDSDEVTGREEAFLYGALGSSLGKLQLGGDLRPAHLHVAFPGGTAGQNLWMNADLLAAYQTGQWTLYGEIGREPVNLGKIDSYEYWVSHQSSGGIGIRVGRFLPAYGVRFADHTAFNRRILGLDVYDQVLGVEISRTTDRHLLQVTISPGRADSIVRDDGNRAFMTSGRFEVDLSSRTSVVGSGLFRDASPLQSRQGVGGIALGFAPTGHVSVWTEGNVLLQQGSNGAAYSVVNETAVEVARGVWLKVSPQIRTTPGAVAGGAIRTAFEVDVLPRTHFNVDGSYYIDRDRTSKLLTKTALIQFHVYL